MDTRRTEQDTIQATTAEGTDTPGQAGGTVEYTTTTRTDTVATTVVTTHTADTIGRTTHHSTVSTTVNGRTYCLRNSSHPVYLSCPEIHTLILFFPP